MRWLAPLALLAAFAGSAAWLLAATRDEPERPARPPAAAAGFRFESRQLNDGPLPLRQVSFPAGDGRATGLLTVPPGRRDPMPAVVYVHGLGADSSDFAPEAIFMAAKGASRSRSTPRTPARRSRGARRRRAPRGPRIRHATTARDRGRGRAARGAPRRRPGAGGARRLQPRRRGLRARRRAARTGWRRRSTCRAPRARTRGRGRSERSIRPARAEADRLLDGIDPVRAFARTRRRRPRLVQFGTRDEVVPVPALRRFARAVPDPKTVTRRATRHALDVVALARAVAVARPPARSRPAGRWAPRGSRPRAPLAQRARAARCDACVRLLTPSLR